jgi:hypothetical protein
MNMYFKGMFLLYKIFEINYMILYIPFDSFKNKMQFRHLIILIYKTQNDIYIVSKLF